MSETLCNAYSSPMISLYRAFSSAGSTRWNALPPHMRGIMLFVMSGVCFSAMSMLSKLLATRLSFFEVAFFRSIIGWVLIWPFLVKTGWGALHTSRPLGYISRGLGSGCGMLCIFYGLKHLPLVDATAYGFTRSLFVVVLAALFLREPIRRDRSLVAVVGFVGVLVMLRPQFGISLGALAALGGALSAAIVIIIIKKLMHSESPVTVMFYFGLATTLITGVPAAWYWTTPSLAEWPMLLVMGALGTAAQGMMVMSYQMTDATVLAPFDYLQLIFASILGYLVFSELPTVWTICGAGLIVAANLYNVYGDRRVAISPVFEDGAK